MGWIDWSWWMKEEEKPAEPLVLGAELECEYGSQRSFLMVETDEISINDLPKACVEDSIAHRNIHPFGQCLKNDECYFKMDLEERWVNAEPQTERVNGKEIITTSSTLICKAAGMAIRAVTSGQDGRFARFQQFLKNMERKYPGLRETLEDPYGSVYLEGNYEMALQFLEEQIKGRGEGLEIVTLYDPKNLEGAYILAALERLMTDCEVRSFEGFMNDLRDTANQQGMQGKEGWDQNYLNEAMMELLRKDCKETAERIETNPVYRGMEKHKMFGSWLRECTEAFAYTTVMYSSALAEGNSSGRRMEGDKGRGAVKKGEGRVDGEGGSKSGSKTDVTTGLGYDAGDTPVRIDGDWTENDMKQALLGHPPRGLGSPDIHHGGQMPGGALHEVLPGQHRNNPALHPNTYNQGVTPEMRMEDRQLHWWYRAREQGADELLPDWIYD